MENGGRFDSTTVHQFSQMFFDLMDKVHDLETKRPPVANFVKKEVAAQEAAAKQKGKKVASGGTKTKR